MGEKLDYLIASSLVLRFGSAGPALDPSIEVIASPNKRWFSSVLEIESSLAIADLVKPSSSYRLFRSFGRTADDSLGCSSGSCVL
jgi:hypothetical protein